MASGNASTETLAQVYEVTKYRVERPSNSYGKYEEGPEYRRLYNHLSKRSREIRLLELEPSSDQRATIRCNLIRTVIDSGVRFEALSYAWGSPGDEQWIIIDDLEVPVRKKLWEALLHLRLHDRKRTIWIDALCIDQKNVAEKNHQVMKMAQIYEAATSVIVWLGIESEDSSTTLRFMGYIGRYRLEYGTDPDIVNNQDMTAEMEGVRRLCQRFYWKRLWIIQEVVVAREVWLQCGMECLSWHDFQSFLFQSSKFDERGRIRWLQMELSESYLARDGMAEKLLDENRIIFPGRFQRQAYRYITLHVMDLALERELRSGGKRNPLYKLLTFFSSSVCSSIKDRVYGVFNLSCDATDLVVDYSKSNFAIFTELIALQRYNPYITNRYSLIHFSQYLLRNTFKGLIRMPEQAHEAPISMATLSYIAGRIAHMGPFYRRYSLSGWNLGVSEHPELKKFLDYYGRDGGILLTVDLFTSQAASDWIKSDVSAIYSETSHGVVGGEEIYDSEIESQLSERLSVAEYKSMQRKNIGKGYSCGSLAQLPRQAQRTRRLDPQQHLEYEGAEPQFFVDDCGRIGIAPSNTQEGDIICRFFKSNILAILRWQVDRYMFVGRATYPQRDGVFLHGKYEDQGTLGLHMNYYTLCLLTK